VDWVRVGGVSGLTVDAVVGISGKVLIDLKYTVAFSVNMSQLRMHYSSSVIGSVQLLILLRMCHLTARTCNSQISVVRDDAICSVRAVIQCHGAPLSGSV